MPTSNRLIFWGVSCLGASTITTQIILLREFLQLFAGNELAYGIILGNWMICTGLGAFSGKATSHLRTPLTWLYSCLVAVGVLPIFQVSIIRSLTLLYVPGQALGLSSLFYTSLAVILPYCLVTGFMLPLFCKLVESTHKSTSISKIYTLDTIGDICGGLVFSFVLVYHLSTFQTLYLLLFLNLTTATILAKNTSRTLSALSISLIVITLGSISLFDLDRTTAKLLFHDQELISQQTTPYGRIAVTRKNNQISIYHNGQIIGSDQDIIAAEEGVHYALSQHQKPQDILLVGGAINGMLQEIDKYDPAQVDYLELDPTMLVLTKKLWPQSITETTRLTSEDPRQFINNQSNAYDAILLNTADPSSTQLNRLFTFEFFQQAAKALRNDGILCFSLSGADNYVNPELRTLISTTHKTLSQVFNHVLIIPGSRHYFLAANHELDYAIQERLTAKNISTTFVNNNFLKAKLNSDRLTALKQIIETTSQINRDFTPIIYKHSLQYWLSHFQSSLFLPILAITALMVTSLLLIHRGPIKAVNLALVSSGFAGMGLEIVLLIVFQVTLGVVFQKIGIVFTAFLLGCAGGATWSGKSKGPPVITMALLDVAFVFFSITLAVILRSYGSDLNGLPPAMLSIIIPASTCLVGFLTGAQLPLAAKTTSSSIEATAAKLYGLDFLGSALGALLITIFVIPRFGLPNTCLILALCKFASCVLLYGQRNYKPSVQLPLHKTKNIAWPSPVLTLLIFLTIGLLVALDISMPTVYAFTFWTPYQWLLILMMFFGMSYAMINHVPGQPAKQKQFSLIKTCEQFVSEHTRLSLFRWAYYLAFSLVVFFPIFRCYFKVPYLFCHVCPRRCIFGVLRPYLVPAALIMNLERRFWCHHACPIGTFADCQAKIAGTPRQLSKYFKTIPIALLLLATYGYFRVLNDQTHPEASTTDWFHALLNNTFNPSVAVITISVALLFAVFLVRRFFCEYLCPIGTVSNLIIKCQKAIFKENHGK